MIIANIPHNGTQLTVEILSVFTTGDGRKLAAVRALAGQPFTTWTHGGPADSSSANVRADRLSDIALSVDLAAPELAPITTQTANPQGV